MRKIYRNTVNSEFFVFFSRNFADVRFHENKTLTKWKITLSFTDVGKACPSGDFLTCKICLNNINEK